MADSNGSIHHEQLFTPGISSLRISVPNRWERAQLIDALSRRYGQADVIMEGSTVIVYWSGSLRTAKQLQHVASLVAQYAPSIA